MTRPLNAAPNAMESRMKKFLTTLAGAAALIAAQSAQAGALDALKAFVQDTKSGRAEFTQTVTSPDGKRTKTSSGSFEFQRPDRFRFDYQKPYTQLIVGDGAKVWLFDPDLNQATVRKMDKALGETPAALLAGSNIERDFNLADQPAAEGLDWVLATPKRQDGTLQSVRIGFRGAQLAAVEIIDAFGQKSVLRFSTISANVALPTDHFRFVPPPGADVVEQ